MKPPQFNSNIRVSHSYRFIADTTGVSNKVITSALIMGAAGSICTVANTTVNSMFTCFKIKDVKIWSPVSQQGANTTCSVEWIGTAQAPSIEISDSSSSVSQPATVSCKPPRNSNAAFWQNPNIGSNNLFNITAPAGSIVDLGLDLIMCDEVAASYPTTVAAGVLGHPYYLALDGTVGNHLPPASLSSTQ